MLRTNCRYCIHFEQHHKTLGSTFRNLTTVGLLLEIRRRMQYYAFNNLTYLHSLNICRVYDVYNMYIVHRNRKQNSSQDFTRTRSSPSFLGNDDTPYHFLVYIYPTGGGFYQSRSCTDLKCVGKVWPALVRLACELVFYDAQNTK